jgi:hypothetical protein
MCRAPQGHKKKRNAKNTGHRLLQRRVGKIYNYGVMPHIAFIHLFIAQLIFEVEGQNKIKAKTTSAFY